MPSRLTPLQAQPCRLSRPAVICPLGDDLTTLAESLFGGRRGLLYDDAFTPGRRLPLGKVTAELPDSHDWPAMHRSRNNQLLAAALERLAPTLDAFRQRRPEACIGVILGTSTSGIGETEVALAAHQRDGEWPASFRYQRHEIGSSARFVADRLGVNGPAYTLSTACTSSARALASAKRLLASGACDAVIAGGADSLCGLTVNGFASLDALSDNPCLPFSSNRDGINLGEAAALFLVTDESGGVQLSGYGETSDAYHISAPRPDGQGAIAAMQAALAMARLPASAIDYLNLHGTATRQNDSMEALAVAHVFGESLACSSTKALTGHTLGACGAMEAAFCWLTLEAGRLPPQIDDGHTDPDLPALNYVKPCVKSHIERHGTDNATGTLPPAGTDTTYACTRTLSNAFAFGGNNAALLLERFS